MEQYKANYGKAKRDWERAQRLGPSDALARSSYDSYQSAFEVATANLQVGQASIKVAQASIVQAEADLDRAQQNLGYCTIVSPVDGVIIDRRVNIGQTVVASLSAPSLFLIAKDLRRVQIWVSVNEADIGQIHVGQPVAFTVDAFPEQKFKGQVGKVRLNAGMTQNVVTYTVEVTTDNSDGKLLPYLTANVKFETARAEDALLVPNAALRWAPAEASAKAPDSTFGAGARSARSGSSAAAGTTGTRPAARGADGASTATLGGRRRGEGWGEGRPRRRHTDDATSGTTQTIQRGTLWVLENEAVRPIPVMVGITDGIDTAVRSPELKEGMAIVTNAISADTKTAAASPARSSSASPFIPQMPRRDRRAGGPGGPPGP
jgi:HlyD family secretion protein